MKFFKRRRCFSSRTTQRRAATRYLCAEPLEARDLLATFVWSPTDGGYDNIVNWSAPDGSSVTNPPGGDDTAVFGRSEDDEVLIKPDPPAPDPAERQLTEIQVIAGTVTFDLYGHRLISGDRTEIDDSSVILGNGKASSAAEFLTGSLHLGQGLVGEAHLNVTDNVTLTVSGYTEVGLEQLATLSIDGDASASLAYIEINGFLNVSNGANVTTDEINAYKNPNKTYTPSIVVGSDATLTTNDSADIHSGHVFVDGGNWLSGADGPFYLDLIWTDQTGDGLVIAEITSGGFLNTRTGDVEYAWVLVDGAGSVWQNTEDVAIGEHGTLRVSNHGVVTSLGIQNDGIIVGGTNGYLEVAPVGAVTNAGRIFIGDSPEIDVFKIAGDFVQQSEGELNIEFGGPIVGTQYDQLQITELDDGYAGFANLDGKLDVTLVDGFDVAHGLLPWRLGGPTTENERHTFYVLTAKNGLSDEFFNLKEREQIRNDDDSVSPVPDVAAHYEWRIAYDTDNQYDQELADKYPIFHGEGNQPWVDQAPYEVALVLEDTLIAHYKLDSGDEQHIVDSAWEDHNGLLDDAYGYGTEYVTDGFHDGALKFVPREGEGESKIESSDRDEEAPPKPGLDIGYGDFAATAWFKADTRMIYDPATYAVTQPAGVVRLVEKVSGDSGAKIGYSVRVEDNILKADIWDGAGGHKSLSVPIAENEAGDWHHAALSVDVDGNFELWLDADEETKDSADAFTTAVEIENSETLLIGSPVLDLADFQSGTETGIGDAVLDDVKIFNEGLNASELAEVAGNHAPQVNTSQSQRVTLSTQFSSAGQTSGTFSTSLTLVGASDVDPGGLGLGGVAIVSADTSIATIEFRNSTDEAFQQLEREGLGEQSALAIRQDGEIRITTDVPFIGTLDDILGLVAVDKTFNDWGETVDVTERGGNTPFSEDTINVEWTITLSPPVHVLSAVSDGEQLSGQATGEVSNFGSSRYASSAFDGVGNYISVWEGDGPSGYGIYGRSFNADGSPRAATMLISDPGASAYYPSVATDGYGQSVALWSQYDSYGQPQLFARAFDPNGVPLGSAFQVSDYAGSTSGLPTIVANDYGQFLAVWSGYNSIDYNTHVYGRRLYAGGVAGSQVQIDSGSSQYNYVAYYSRAAGIDNSGNIVVGWQQYDAYSNPQLVVQRLDTFDMPLGGEIVVSNQASYSGGGPAVAVADDGRFAAAWDVADSYSSHVFVQLFDPFGNFVALQQADDPFAGIYNMSPALAFDGQQSLAVAWLRDWSTVAANWFDASSGYPLQMEQVVNDVVGAGSVNSGPGIAGGENGETFIAWQTYDNLTYQDHVFGRLYGVGGMPQDAGSQLDLFGGAAYAWAYGDSPSTAFGLHDGGYVTVWAGDEGQGNGVYGQVFTADGTANGSPVLLSNPTVQSAYSPSVAVGPYGWTFAVAYAGYDVATYTTEVFVDVFNLDGSPIYGMPTNVSEHVGTTSGGPTIVSDGNGYAVAWTAYDYGGTGSEVYVRRSDSTGYAWGNTLQVNDELSGYRSVAYYGPSAAADGIGNLVVTWQDAGGPSGAPQLKGRLLDSTNVPLTGEFLIAEAQSYSGGPTVATDDASGNFVIAWDAVNANWTAADVYVQRYNAQAAPVGDTQKVNSSEGLNYYPGVAIDGEQRIGVTWGTQGANGYTTVRARWFDSAGQPATDEVWVNSAVGSAGNMYGAPIAASGDGEFVIAWSAYDAATSYYHVYQRQYCLQTIDVFTEITVTQNSAPVVIDLRQYFDGDASLTFTLEGNDNEALTSGSIDDWLLTLDVTAEMTGAAGLTIRGTDGIGAFSEVLLTLMVVPQ